MCTVDTNCRHGWTKVGLHIEDNGSPGLVQIAVEDDTPRCTASFADKEFADKEETPKV